MAKLGEKAFDFKEVLKSCRIPVSCAGDQWFLNVGKNSVVNVHDQKTLHTWTLTHPHYFTSSIVHWDGYLYCVMDKNVLIRWSIEEDNLKDADKIKFQDSIFAVIPVIAVQPMIIFESGKYAMITREFGDMKPSDFAFLKEDEHLIWIDACASVADIEVFCLTFNYKKKYRIIYNFTVNRENYSTSHLISHKIHHENAVLKSWCLNHHDFLFLSLWSDGKLYSHNIKESKDTDFLKFKDIEENTVVDITSIDFTHIAIAKAHSKQEECILEIWDLKCGILKAQKVFKTPSLDYIQIAAINSNIFLCLNNELLSIPFHIEDPTFHAALGMLESNKYVQHSWSAELELVQLPTNDEPEVMDVCSKDDSLDSVAFIVEKLVNENSPELMCVPESELVKLLQLAIRYSKENNDEQCFEKNLYILLNIVFSASFSDMLLVKYLKRINLEETLISLKWLLSFLNHVANVPSSILEKPSDLQIVNWICLIIQSHTEALLFSKDKTSQKLLKQLEKTLSIKMEEYEDFDCIQSYFSIMEKKEILPQKCSVGNYCMENIEI